MSALAIQYLNKLSSLVLAENPPLMARETFWARAVEKLENLGRGNGEHAHYHLHTVHSLSDDTKQFVRSLAEAYQHNMGTQLQIIINTMATKAQVLAAEGRLSEAIAQEKVELKEALDTQAATIAALKEQIETGDNPELDEIVTKLDADTAAVQRFVEPLAPA